MIIYLVNFYTGIIFLRWNNCSSFKNKLFNIYKKLFLNNFYSGTIYCEDGTIVLLSKINCSTFYKILFQEKDY
jgi:hypothetical protein